MDNFPNRYPEDYELISTETIYSHLTENQVVAKELITLLTGVIEDTPISACERLLEAYKLIDHENIWNECTNRNDSAVADLRHAWHTLQAYASARVSIKDQFPKLASVELSYRQKCISLEPTSKHFIGQLYNSARKLSVALGSLLTKATHNTLQPYRLKAFATRITRSQSNKNENIPLNPLMSEQYFSLLTTNVGCYKRVVQLQRAFGGTPTLVELNTYSECLLYAKNLNDVILRFDKDIVDKEVKLLSKVSTRMRAMENYSSFMHKQEEYMRLPLAIIELRELPRRDDVRKMPMSDLIYISERVLSMRNAILNTLGIFRAYAMVQTTWQRVVKEQNNSKAST